MQKEKTLKRHLTEPQLERIQSLCPQYRVARLYLFGSALNDQFRQESDIDILVQFEEMPLLEYADNYFDFWEKLQNILDREVDLVIEKDLSNPVLIESINESKVLIYDKKDSEVAA